jgi:hypothetical protein
MKETKVNLNTNELSVLTNALVLLTHKEQVLVEKYSRIPVNQLYNKLSTIYEQLKSDVPQVKVAQ